MTIKQRFLNLLIAIDQLLWVIITLGAGHPDETISSASYRGWRSGHPVGRIAKPVIDFLFWPFEKDHCFNAYLSEVHNKQLPKNFDAYYK